MFLIGEREAELEVVVETLIEQQGGKDEALLYVVKEIYATNKVNQGFFKNEFDKFAKSCWKVQVPKPELQMFLI